MRDIPLAAGRFDLDDFIDHVMQMVRYIGTDTHVIAIRQPSVPVLAATAPVAEADDSCRLASITLMDLPAEFYLQTVFQEHAQPDGG